MIGSSLQKKAVLIVAGILFFILGVNTFVLTLVASDKYRSAILAKNSTAGEAVRKDLGRALELGVTLESIQGVNEKLHELVSRDAAVGYAAVADRAGKVLFHSDQGSVGREIEEKDFPKASPASTMRVRRTGSFYALSFPLADAEGKTVGVLQLGIKSAEINSQVYELLYWALGISLVSFVVSLGLVYFSISKFVTRPIMNMKKAAEKIASGDLTSTIDIDSGDEIASLGGAINTMALNLKDMLSKIQGITGTISHVTSNIVASSQEVISVAGEQKSAVEGTTVAMSEMNDSTSSVAVSAESLSSSAGDSSSAILQMTKSIEQVAENAAVFDESARETASSIEEMVSTIREIAGALENLSSSSDEVASSLSEVNATVREIGSHADESVVLAENVMNSASEKGMEAASAAMEGMENIRKSVGALSDTINGLGERSEDIGKILTVIDEIADQTNLLALNAAILAAQAGEHGRAFAVVADQIKSLAERTSVSTGEIADLIRSVQEDTRSSVEMAADGLLHAEKGLTLVRDVNGALKGIVGSSRMSTEKAKAIQRATFEESEVIKQITEAVTGMSRQVEHISIALQEQTKGSRFIVEATERMKEISHQMKAAIGEQKAGSGQIAGAVENVTGQAEQIAKATGRQKQRSAEIVVSMKRIQDATGKLMQSSNGMSEVIRSLKEEARNLAEELRKFTF